MKGVVFTEFLDFVEGAMGDEIVDDMIERANLPSGGSYTAVGKYDYEEMASLVTELAQLSGKPVPELLQAFGTHLLGRFHEGFPQFFEGKQDTLDMLESVEGHIHVEVRKLYPDAELPTLDARREGPDKLVVRYSSCRPLGDLCIGLIEGCAQHFGDSLTVTHVPTADGLNIEIHRNAAQAA